jgi:hypothetical protein
VELADDVVEVSVFGSGYGESCLVHLGFGSWILIDSLKDPEDSAHIPPIDYLHSLGLDPQSCLKLLVVSHWDEDHVLGISQILQRYPDIPFACSSIFSGREFLKLQGLAARDDEEGTSGNEFRQSFEILLSRAPGRPPAMNVVWCSGDKPVLTLHEPLPVQVTALSPSDASISLSVEAMTGMTRDDRTISFRKENACSVVLSISVANRRILLGGDLERTGDPRTGWLGIANSEHREAARSSLFKVPHHGSDDAWEDRIWDEMLEDGVVAVLTPWSLGRNYLPKDADRSKICENTDNAHIASPGSSARPARRDPTVQRQACGTLLPASRQQRHQRDRQPTLARYGVPPNGTSRRVDNCP